jgi:hypothetical protein
LASPPCPRGATLLLTDDSILGGGKGKMVRVLESM